MRNLIVAIKSETSQKKWDNLGQSWLEMKELTADKWRQKLAKTIYQQHEIETGSSFSLQDNSSDNGANKQ